MNFDSKKGTENTNEHGSTKKYSPTHNDYVGPIESEDCLEQQNGNCVKEPVIDSESEGRTCTSDKGNEEVSLATGKMTEQIFGISSARDSYSNNANRDENKHKSRRSYVDEWIQPSLSVMKAVKNSSDAVAVTPKPLYRIN